jgi:hypothetical protein
LTNSPTDISLNSSRGPKNKEANCENPVVTVSQPVTVEDRNNFLIQARQGFEANLAKENRFATPEDEAAFLEEVKQNAPVEEGTTLAFSDDSSLLPPAQPDPSDLDVQGRPKDKRWQDRRIDKDRNSAGDPVEQFIKKAKKGCHGQHGGTQFVSWTTASYTPYAWYYCVAEAYAKNVFGQKIVRLVQTQDWQVSYYGTVMNWLNVDAEAYNYYFWKTSGGTATQGPYWVTSPWQIRATAKQKFIFDYKVLTIQNQFLSTWVTAGPGNECVMSPTKGPGMP